MADEQKFPSEIVDLPSKGKCYSKDSPLRDGKIEIKYMTTKEEDILTSQNLVKKGIVLDVLLNSLILTEGIDVDDLVIGDKNAVMIASRILAYGPEYVTEIQDPETGEQQTHTFNLTECPFKELPKDVKYEGNLFEFKLPASKSIVKYKLINGRDEKLIAQELKSMEKTGTSADMSTRLKYSIEQIDDVKDKNKIFQAVQNMLSRDSLALRTEMSRISPDIIMKQDVEIGGKTVDVDIPLTVGFFWPQTWT